MKKWVILSLPDEGYTETGAGDTCNNQQLLGIVNADTPKNAVRALQKINPHIFAIDVEFLVKRWSGFVVLELAEPGVSETIILD